MQLESVSGPGPHNQNGNSLESLKHISRVLNIAIETLSIDQAKDLCFNTVYTLCQQKKWGVITFIKNEIDHLVNSKGHSILIACIVRKDKELFQDLLQQEIALHQWGPHKNLPIHYAAEEGHFKFFTELCNINGSDARNSLDQNPLHLAAYNGHLKILVFFSKYPELFRRSSRFPLGNTYLELTPLAWSVFKGHVDCVDFFLQKDASLSQCRVKKFGNLLHFAVAFHQNQVLELLLNSYHDLFSSRINEPNDQHQTPLMLAAAWGNEEAIYLLNKKEASLNITDGKGNTALHYAVNANQKNAAFLLIKLGANCQIRNQDRCAPDDLARSLYDKFGGSMKTIAATIINNTLLRADSLTAESYENLVMQGGGPKGIGLIGALQKLDLSRFKRVAGTSAGSINAALVAVGYSAQEIEERMGAINIKTLLDIDHDNAFFGDWESKINVLIAVIEAIHNPVKASIGLIKSYLKGLWKNKGICKGDVLRNEVENLIREKTKTDFFTFKDLRDRINAGEEGYKHLYICATSVGVNSEILDINSEPTPDNRWDDVPISDAVRGSSGIPGLFKPFELHEMVNGKRVGKKIVVVDGGMLNNFPIDRFDRQKYISSCAEEEKDFPNFNKRTLGISFLTPIVEKEAISHEMSPELFVLKMMQVYYEAETKLRNLNPYSERRVIRIDPLNVGSFSFHLENEQKTKLVQSGRSAVEEFFKKQQNDFSKYFTKEEIVSKIGSMASIGKVPGFYVYQGHWLFCELPIGKTFGTKIYLREYLVNRQLDDYYKDHPFEIAFCECEYDMNIIIIEPDGKSRNEPKNLKLEKGRAETIKLFANIRELTFQIKKG